MHVSHVASWIDADMTLRIAGVSVMVCLGSVGSENQSLDIPALCHLSGQRCM